MKEGGIVRPTPTKPYAVLVGEKKSHRTKKELIQRKQAEESLLSKTSLKERPAVAENQKAHKEFLRIKKLLKEIEKNDALYEPVINRYCMLQAECQEMEEIREKFSKTFDELRELCNKIVPELSGIEKADYLMEFSRNLSKLSASLISCDKQIQTKRKMLLDIEKENIMTIASALRSVPKKEGEKKNALLEALGGG